MALPGARHPRRGRKRRRPPPPRGALTRERGRAAGAKLTQTHERTRASEASPYDAAFLAHAREPVGRGRLGAPTATARRENPLCGDAIEVDVEVEDSRVRAVGHRGRACAVVTVSASLMTKAVGGSSAAGAGALAAELREALLGRRPFPDALAALAPVRLLPTRHRCALLPWEALLAALDGSG